MEQQPEKKQVIFSGIQPSGVLTLGNYIGALRNFVRSRSSTSAFTAWSTSTPLPCGRTPATLRRRTTDTLALLLAAGLSPERSTLFMQSHVAAHAELGWVLDCFTYMGRTLAHDAV